MARSSNGSGNIRKKKVTRNGKTYEYWEARFTTGYNPATGKQIQRSISGSTQKEVAKKLRAELAKVDSNTYTAPSKLTVGEWLDLWIEEYIQPSLKPSTHYSYKYSAKTYIKPYLGNVRLSELTALQIQTMCNKLAKTNELSPATVKLSYVILHKALNQAVELGYIPTNPSTSVKLSKAAKKEINPLSNDEIKAFVNEVKPQKTWNNPRKGKNKGKRGKTLCFKLSFLAQQKLSGALCDSNLEFNLKLD